MLSKPPETTLRRFIIAVVFGIAFGYIEAAVVVYLRAIFYPDGFAFPLYDFVTDPIWQPYLLVEIGRETATIVLILTACYLFGRNAHQRAAYFLIIFAVWDIFYYVWLKLLLDWPASIMEWDILFLMPTAWASPVLYPVLVSIAMLVFAVIILYRDTAGKPIKVAMADWIILAVGAVIVVISFCTPAGHITEADYASYFYRPLFALGYIIVVGAFVRCLLKSK